MLQMFPWGWLREDGLIEREPMFMNVATSLNQSYYHWLSPDMANGLLQACARKQTELSLFSNAEMSSF